MKDLDETRFLLGIGSRRQVNGDVFIVQERYARDVVKRFNMEGCKPVSTPLDLGSQLDSSQKTTNKICSAVARANVSFRCSQSVVTLRIIL